MDGLIWWALRVTPSLVAAQLCRRSITVAMDGPWMGEGDCVPAKLYWWTPEMDPSRNVNFNHLKTLNSVLAPWPFQPDHGLLFAGP